METQIINPAQTTLGVTTTILGTTTTTAGEDLRIVPNATWIPATNVEFTSTPVQHTVIPYQPIQDSKTHSVVSVFGFGKKGTLESGFLDLLYIPFNKKDYDSQTFHPSTRFHKEKDITPGVLDFHGTAFGGSPYDVGKVIERWDDEEGKWATIQLDPSSENYFKYLDAARKGNLYCSPGAIDGYFSYDEKGNITDWATGEISLIIADGTKRPKNWYAIAKPRSESILKAAGIKYEPLFQNVSIKKEDDEEDEDEDETPKKSPNLKSALKRFLRHAGFERDYVDSKIDKLLKAGLLLEEENKQNMDNKNPCNCADEAQKASEIQALKGEIESLKAILSETESTLKAKLSSTEAELQTKVAETVALKARLDEEINESLQKQDESFLKGLIEEGKIDISAKETILGALKAARIADNGGLKGTGEGTLTKALKSAYSSRPASFITGAVVPLVKGTTDPKISSDLVNRLLIGAGYQPKN